MSSFIDPRDFTDRQLFLHIVLGDLPRPGWPGRRRVIAQRLLVDLAIAAGVVAGLALLRLAVIVLWAVAS